MIFEYCLFLVGKSKNEKLSIVTFRKIIGNITNEMNKIVDQIEQQTNNNIPLTPKDQWLQYGISQLGVILTEISDEFRREPCPIFHTNDFENAIIRMSKHILENNDNTWKIDPFENMCSELVKAANNKTLTFDMFESAINSIGENVSELADRHPEDKNLQKAVETIVHEITNIVDRYESIPCPLLHTNKFQREMSKAGAELTGVKVTYYLDECNPNLFNKKWDKSKAPTRSPQLASMMYQSSTL